MWKPDGASLHPHGALPAPALYKVLMSFHQFEKWTWQQMLVFLREIKCLNNSQECPFSPLDNKVSALPSTLWHWSRCPSLSNVVRGLPWPLVTPAKKTLGFSDLPRVFVTLNIKSLPFRLNVLFSSSCVNEQIVSGVYQLVTDLLLFHIICLCFDVKLINQRQPVCHKQWRFWSAPSGHNLTRSKMKSNQILSLCYLCGFEWDITQNWQDESLFMTTSHLIFLSAYEKIGQASNLHESD